MPTIKPYPDFFSHTDPQTLHDIQTVTRYLAHTYDATCYVVGGAVRDRILGYGCKDYDIECFGIGVEDFENAMGYLGAQGVGKSFFVYKYHDLDISLPRTEQKVSKGHKGFTVALAKDEMQASKRRDFTVNALMYDIFNEHIVDFWYGLEDLSCKVLRVVDAHAFKEDSLRVLRAMQLAARFGFEVDAQSCAICCSMALDDLPKERLFGEFDKMFRGAFLHYGLYYLFRLGIFEKLFAQAYAHPFVLERNTFVALGRRLQHAQAHFVQTLRPYYFLFITAPYLQIDTTQILNRLGAPKRYYQKIIATPLPDEVGASFVASMALKEGIEAYVGNYDARVRALAVALGVWDKPYESGIYASELLEQGYRGEALGRELRLRIEAKIMTLQEK